MVDRYIPNVSLCLKDPDPFIRKQTLILLTNLLQVKRVPARTWQPAPGTSVVLNAGNLSKEDFKLCGLLLLFFFAS